MSTTAPIPKSNSFKGESFFADPFDSKGEDSCLDKCGFSLLLLGVSVGFTVAEAPASLFLTSDV